MTTCAYILRGVSTRRQPSSVLFSFLLFNLRRRSGFCGSGFRSLSAQDCSCGRKQICMYTIRRWCVIRHAGRSSGGLWFDSFLFCFCLWPSFFFSRVKAPPLESTTSFHKDCAPTQLHNDTYSLATLFPSTRSRPPLSLNSLCLLWLVCAHEGDGKTPMTL